MVSCYIVYSLTVRIRPYQTVYFMQGVVFAAVMADAAMVERAIALDVAVG